MLRDSDKPEAEAGDEGVVFLTKGELTLTRDGGIHRLEGGGHVWKVSNDAAAGDAARVQWIRKAHEPLDGSRGLRLHVASPLLPGPLRRRAGPVPVTAGLGGAWYPEAVKYESLWIGMLLGAALGFAIGVTTADKPFTGLLIGVAVGALVGLAARKDPTKG